MGTAEILSAILALSQLASKLVAEQRAATDAEIETALASVKARQATENADWANGSQPPPAADAPTV